MAAPVTLQCISWQLLLPQMISTHQWACGHLLPPDVSSLGRGPSPPPRATVTSLMGRLSEHKRLSSDKSLTSHGMAPMGWPNAPPHQYRVGKPIPLSHLSSPSLLPLPGWCPQHPFCQCFSSEGEWEQVVEAGGRGEEERGEQGGSQQHWPTRRVEL